MTGSMNRDTGAVLSPLNVVLLAFIALGVVARLLGLSINGYWLDELATVVHFANPEVPFERLLTEVLPTDNSPPLYYLTLYVWSSLFGQSEQATRSLSVVFGVAAVFSPFVLRGPAASLRRTLLLSALIACSYAAIFYSQEARAYSLLILLSALATFTFVNIDSALARSEGIAKSDLLWLLVFSVLLAYTHYFGFLLFCALYSILGARALLVRNFPVVLKLISHGVVVVLLLVPWILLVLYKQEDFISAFRNDPLYIARHLAVFVYWLAGNVLAAAICALLLVGYVGFDVTYFLRLRRRPAAREWRFLARQHNIPIVIFAILFILSVIVSVAVAPIISYRNYLVALPAFFLYVVYALEFFSKLLPPLRKTLTPSMALLLGILLFGSLYDYYRPHKEHWRQSAAYIEGIDDCSTAEIAVLGQRERWKGLYEFYLDSPDVRITPIVFDRDGHVVTGDAVQTVRRILQQSCPVKIWAAHLQEDRLTAILGELEVPRDITITRFHRVFVVERQVPL